MHWQLILLEILVRSTWWRDTMVVDLNRGTASCANVHTKELNEPGRGSNWQFLCGRRDCRSFILTAPLSTF